MAEQSPGSNDPLDQPTNEELWKEFATTASVEVRGELFRRHMFLVRFQAERLIGTLPKSVEIDDLVSEGNFGLLDAIKKFDPERGIKFRTYCGTRIRGAMLDSLRSQDWVPRLVRYRANLAERTRQKYMSEHGREPTDEELAQTLELPVEMVRRKSQAHAMMTVSDRSADTGEQRATMDTLSESNEDNPLDFVTRSDLLQALTRPLSEKEKRILTLYYLDGLNLREIGEQLALTESRVCQIHGNVIKRLRERLADSADAYSL